MSPCRHQDLTATLAGLLCRECGVRADFGSSTDTIILFKFVIGRLDFLSREVELLRDVASAEGYHSCLKCGLMRKPTRDRAGMFSIPGIVSFCSDCVPAILDDEDGLPWDEEQEDLTVAFLRWLYLHHRQTASFASAKTAWPDAWEKVRAAAP